MGSAAPTESIRITRSHHIQAEPAPALQVDEEMEIETRSEGIEQVSEMESEIEEVLEVEQPLVDEYPSEDDAGDESKSEGEIEAIQYEMQQLLESVPKLKEQYRLVGRLGEGTFSSVYKAVDLLHNKYDNHGWDSDTSSAPQTRTGKVYVALKRIYVTSSPTRIFNELDILNDLREAPNVAFLIAAIRHEDQVIAVMPYNRHQDFRSYYRTATLPLLRSYFSCLFRALSATHDKMIIHRDVKPANFLYDIETGEGILCDFGLAQKVGGDELYEWKSECCHSLPGPSTGGLEAREIMRKKVEALPLNKAPGLLSGLHGARLSRPVPLYDQSLAFENDWALIEHHSDKKKKPWFIPEEYKESMQERLVEKAIFYKSWTPATSANVGHAAAGKKDRVGYLKEDRRPNVRANRAGTRGFRAPEVLLKCPDQTVALDIWSVGIMMLCFLTRRFPFFNSNDDTEALVEIAAIFGRKRMERCAAVHNRTFVSNIPSLEPPPHASLHALVKSLNPPIVVENSPNPYGPIPSTAESDAEWYEGSELFDAVDLMKRCLEMDGTRRWTAEECLEHPFFLGEHAGKKN